jgi:CRP-like cAMP-binding protein/pSer/pThr/pTyr-binding forkhead associated (FHA) protein
LAELTGVLKRNISRCIFVVAVRAVFRYNERTKTGQYRVADFKMLTTKLTAADEPVTPYILITSGPQKGTRIGLNYERLAEKPLVLGRQMGEADIVLQSSQNKISRRHAALGWREGDQKLTLSDLASSNGTRLNCELIMRNVPVPLLPGDSFSLGDIELVYVLPVIGAGVPLALLPGQTERVYPEDNEPGYARLQVVSTTMPGLRSGAICRLTPQHPFAIGRLSDANDLTLLEEGENARLVSRRHVEIRWTNGQYIIYDRGAANPAWVGQNRVESSTPVVLEDGNAIQVGLTILRYRAPRLPVENERPETVKTDAKTYLLRYSGTKPLLKGARQVILPVARQILIGRSDQNDLRLQDRRVSNRHARLLFEAGRYLLADLGSSNGTFVNGQRIENRAVLSEGDNLRFGDFEFVLETASQNGQAVRLNPEKSTDELPTVNRDTALLDNNLSIGEKNYQSSDDEPTDPILNPGEKSSIVSLDEPVAFRLQANAAVNVPDETGVIPSATPDSTGDASLLAHPLRRIAPFDELDGETFWRIAPVFKPMEFKAGQEIVREGRGRGLFLAITEGRVNISRALNEKQRLVLGELQNGSVYGERTITADQNFSNRLEAVTPVSALVLEEATFLREFGKDISLKTFFEQQVAAASALTWLRATLLMRTLSERTLAAMSKRLRLTSYDQGETLAESGAAADEFFIIVSGKAAAFTSDNEDVATLEEGDTFGDGIAATGETYPLSLRAVTGVECFKLSRADFESVLARSGDPLASSGAGLGGLPLGAVLNKVPPFNTMPPQLVAQIAAELKPKFFKKGEVIVRQDEPASAFYIIRRGQVEISFRTSAGEERADMRLGPGKFFGEASLLTNTARTDTVKAVEDCELLALYRNKLETIMKLGENYNLPQYFARNLSKSFRPKRKPGVTVTELTDSQDEKYYILAHGDSDNFRRLNERSYFLWNLMDGDNSLNDLSMAYFLEFMSLDLEGASNFVGQLQAAGFLEVPTIDQKLVATPEDRPKKRSLFSRLLNWRYDIKNVDRIFSSIYNWGGQAFFWSPVAWLVLIAIVSGFTGFIFWGFLDQSAAQRGVEKLLFGAAGLLAMQAALPWYGLLVAIAGHIVVHEIAHGLAVKHYRRRILSGGFGLQYGSPVFYVNTNDMWLEKRIPRIIVSLAGPASNALISGVCCLLMFLPQSEGTRTALFQIASVGYLLFFMNINPLFELDGYYALSDWFEIPALRRKAFAYVRRKLTGQPIRREFKPGETRLYWIYVILTPIWLGITTLLFTVFLRGLFASFHIEEVLRISPEISNYVIWLVIIGIVGVLALPMFAELFTLGKDEDDNDAARRKRRRRK